MRWVLLLCLAACGQGEVDEPYGAGECVAACERVKPELITNFGVSKVNCFEAEFVFATSPASCSGIFERRWNVQLR